MEPLDFSQFEPLEGKAPYTMLDRHPDGRHVALQAIPDQERAAVWDVETRRIVWQPENVNALVWLPGGERVAYVHEHYQHSPNHPAMIGSKLQSEFTYALALAIWPGGAVQGSCRLTFPQGWPTDLIVSPRGDLAIVEWHDQEESGLEFVALFGDEPRQVARSGLPHLTKPGRYPSAGGFPLDTPLLCRSAFSPSGRYILVPWLTGSRSMMKFEHQDPEEHLFATISVLDWETRTHWTIPLTERVPEEWKSHRHRDEIAFFFSTRPMFLDDEHFTMALPTGTVREYSVSDGR